MIEYAVQAFFLAQSCPAANPAGADFRQADPGGALALVAF